MPASTALVRGRLHARTRANVPAAASHTCSNLSKTNARYAPDVEFEFDPGQQALDLGGIFHGHKGILAGLGQLAEGLEMRFEPAYVLDLGDRGLALGFFHAQAPASGVQLEGEIAQLGTPREGLIVRDQSWYGWEKGLRAAGLDPDAIVLPTRGRAGQRAE